MNVRVGTLVIAAALAGSAARAAEPKELELERVAVRHPAIKNMVACDFLMPRGWKFGGGLKNYPWAFHQVCLESTISNPNSLEQIETLPWSHCVWHTRHANPAPRLTLDRAGLFSLEPLTPREVIEKVTLDQVRKGTGARIVEHDDLPVLAKFYDAAIKKIDPGATVQAGRTRITYKVAGKDVEEDFYLVLYYNNADVGAGKTTFWGPVFPPFALRAARGQLDEVTPRLLTTVHSFRINPEWADELAHTQALFCQRVSQATLREAELSKRISANNDAIVKMIRDADTLRTGVNERAARNFSDYIRGVQEFRKGNTTYALPNTHKHAWVDGLGNVVMSNDPNFNPNVRGRAGNWSALERSSR